MVIAGPTAAPLPEVAVVQVGTAFRRAHPGVLGFDGGYSLPLGHGRSLWVFGDTLLGGQRAGRAHLTGFPTNTAALVQDVGWSAGFPVARFLGGFRPRPILLPADARHRRWPLDLYREGGQDGLYHVDVLPRGQGMLDFTIEGYGLARRRSSDLGPFGASVRLWPGQAPAFGTSVLSWQGWRYVYAGGATTHLARVRPGREADVTAYTYYAGGVRWARTWPEALAFAPSGPEMSVRYDRYLGAFVMVALPPFGRTIEARFAPRPWGPWSGPLALARCQPAGVPGLGCYGARQHAELDRDAGRTIVVSYDTNLPGAELASHPEVYWPRLLAVTFTRSPASRAILPP